MSDAVWNLDRTQHLLWRLITAPEGVAKGLVEECDLDERSLASVLASDERLGAVERLDIYANMYFARLLDVLRTDYPVLARWLGETHFHNLITDYLLAHPPTHFSLRYAGEPLAAFLETHPLSADRPWLADLARFEWALVDAFDAADAEAVDAGALAEIGADDWPGLRFAAVPSVRVLQLRWRVQPAWLHAEANEERENASAAEPIIPERDERAVRVWRKEHEVLHREIDEAESVALAALVDARPFGEICSAVGERVGGEQAVALVASMLATWLADGLIASVAVPRASQP